ncbi:hypothetical protein Cfor_05532 [Coptotermes formosanus]|uniref:Uncharacterized protein n=1 Tax=Coptotermes formosanus TaxID=36987 RepID=A0A6L2PKY9_COPFO|nr:hypothetical protein Cfor_05532 [Coptotermes formosanus]
MAALDAGFSGQFHVDADSVVMDSLLFPVTADFHIEDFDDTTLDQMACRLLCQFYYMPNTFAREEAMCLRLPE